MKCRVCTVCEDKENLQGQNRNFEWEPLQIQMKKVNKQCLLDTPPPPRTVRVREKTCQVIVQTSRL